MKSGYIMIIKKRKIIYMQIILFSLLTLSISKADDYHYLGGCSGKCDDNTYSFEQPDSRGPGGYEGKCGQTAVSNLIAMNCDVEIAPGNCDTVTKDYTPGSRPSTVIGLLNHYRSTKRSNCRGKGRWKIFHSQKELFIGDIYRALTHQKILERERIHFPPREDKYVSPVAILVEMGAPHWIVIVDMLDYGTKDCKVIFNTWGDQYWARCETLTKWANMGGKSSCQGVSTKLACGNFTYVQLTDKKFRGLKSIDQINKKDVKGYFTKTVPRYYYKKIKNSAKKTYKIITWPFSR